MAFCDVALLKKRVVTVVFAFVALTVIAAGTHFLNPIRRGSQRYLLYVPPASLVKFVSGTFHSFAADIFYIKGILSLSDELPDTLTRIRWVHRNFETALRLDRQLVQAYFFAGIVGAKDESTLQEGIGFLKALWPLNPNEWRIPYWIGFDYYQLGKYDQAIPYFQQAARLPDAPSFITSNQAMLFYKAGKSREGAQYLQGLLASLEDRRQVELITQKVEWLQLISFLESKIDEYAAIYAKLPQSLEELVERQIIPYIPADPFGEGFYYDRKTGRVKSYLGISEPGKKFKDESRSETNEQQ